MGDADTDSIEAWLAERPNEGARYGRLRCGTCVGEWHVEAYLGAGLSSEVYRVRHLNLSYEGALKLLVNDQKNLRTRFMAEINAMRFLSLSALPRFFGAGTYGGRPYYVMEYLLPLPDPMPRGDVPGFMNKVAKAVQTLHEAGFVHRDLKPGNIMLRRSGDPVLIDLGLVKQRANAHTPLGWKPSSVSMVDGKPVGVGTISFAAPEQLLEGKSLVQGDVFSLGKIAWYLYEKNPPQNMRSIIHRATREIPEERYESAQAFAAAVRRRNRWMVVMSLLGLLGVSCLAFSIVFRGEIKKKVVNWLVPEMRAMGPQWQDETAQAVPDLPVPQEDPAAAVPVASNDEGETNVVDVASAGKSEPDVQNRHDDEMPETNPDETLETYPDETPEEYFERMLPLAKGGLVPAQVKVAEALFHGKGTPLDREAAVEWYRKAADAGDPSAQASMGYCLFNGLGCEKNRDEAFAWYERGARQNDPNAIHGLAYSYLHGYGVKKDAKRGFELAMKAAENNHVPSLRLVGECYLATNGTLGVEYNRELGLQWVRKAAEQGNKGAQVLLLSY